MKSVGLVTYLIFLNYFMTLSVFGYIAAMIGWLMNDELKSTWKNKS
jgi:hypothetical protein